jgi:hypothetical protein
VAQPSKPGRFEPRPNDLVDFPVTKDGQTIWVPTTFQQSGKALIVRIGGAAYYIDKNFMQMHNIAYNGTTTDGRRKFTVFLRPVAQRPQRRYTVKLWMGTEHRSTTHLARSPDQALTFAVIQWCKDSQIPEYKFRVMISHFQHKDPGYNYEVAPLQ